MHVYVCTLYMYACNYTVYIHLYIATVTLLSNIHVSMLTTSYSLSYLLHSYAVKLGIYLWILQFVMTPSICDIAVNSI